MGWPPMRVRSADAPMMATARGWNRRSNCTWWLRWREGTHIADRRCLLNRERCRPAMPVAPRKTTATLAAILSLAHIAHAESVAETAAAWGLMGTWATDCRLPPSEGNSYLSYAVASGGRLAHERDVGFRRDVAEVLRATQ